MALGSRGWAVWSGVSHAQSPICPELPCCGISTPNAHSLGLQSLLQVSGSQHCLLLQQSAAGAPACHGGKCILVTSKPLRPGAYSTEGSDCGPTSLEDPKPRRLLPGGAPKELICLGRK